MKVLTIDEKVEIIREFLQEEGSGIRLSIYQKPSKVEAEKTISRFAEKMGVGFHFNSTNSWVSLDYCSGIDMTVYYQESKEEKKAQLLEQLKYLEEDVDLSGGSEEIA